MEREQIGKVKGDESDTIDSLIEYLEMCKEKGATHYDMEWSNDPQWAFKWFVTYRNISKEEIKEAKIKKLYEEIEQLKNEIV